MFPFQLESDALYSVSRGDESKLLTTVVYMILTMSEGQMCFYKRKVKLREDM